MNAPIPKTKEPSKDTENDQFIDVLLSEKEMAELSLENRGEIFTAYDGVIAYNGKIYKDREEFELEMKAFILWLKFRRFFSFNWLWKRKKKPTS